MSKTYGKYNEKNVYSMADSPKNKQESEDYANALYSSGYYPAGLGGCFTVGISGGCGSDCWVFKKGECENYIEVFEEMIDDEILELYDDGYYEEEIKEYFTSKNKLDLLSKGD